MKQNFFGIDMWIKIFVGWKHFIIKCFIYHNQILDSVFNSLKLENFISKRLNLPLIDVTWLSNPISFSTWVAKFNIHGFFSLFNVFCPQQFITDGPTESPLHLIRTRRPSVWAWSRKRERPEAARTRRGGKGSWAADRT